MGKKRKSNMLVLGLVIVACAKMGILCSEAARAKKLVVYYQALVDAAVNDPELLEVLTARLNEARSILEVAEILCRTADNRKLAVSADYDDMVRRLEELERLANID